MRKLVKVVTASIMIAVMSLTAVAAFSVTTTTVEAASGTWIKSGNRWWYRHSDGGYTRNNWELIGGKWYFFDWAGWMVTGWFEVKSEQDPYKPEWYYTNSNGEWMPMVHSYKLNYIDSKDGTTFANEMPSKYVRGIFRPGEVDWIKNGFYSNSEYVKYWSSHGSKTGKLWGTRANGTEYANSMIGSYAAVRAIAGYHEEAPKSASGRDKAVVTSFIEESRKKRSVRTAWANANIAQSLRYNYAVLTHAGDAKDSCIDGFGGTSYARPNNSWSILRFSNANPNGTPSETIKSFGVSTNLSTVKETLGGLRFAQDISEQKNELIPDYAIVGNKKEIDVVENVETMVSYGEGKVTTSSSGLGDQKVDFDSDEAKEKSIKWIDDSFVGIGSEELDMNRVEVSPVVMAEVNLSGGEEIEEIVAYTVTFENQFEGFPIEGEQYSAIVDNEGISYSIIEWNQYSKVLTRARGQNKKINLEEASLILSTYLSSIFEEHTSKVSDVELSFVLDEITQRHVPAWSFIFETGEQYYVNCFTGNITSK